jgi:ATP-dependent Lon protease
MGGMESVVKSLGELPIFPLPEIVLFPGAPVALHIFEPRYRAMLDDCLASFGALAVARILPGELDPEGNPRLAPVAGAGVIVEHEKLADGRSNILLLGQARVALAELPFRAPYRRARAEILRDRPEDVQDRDTVSLISSATSFVQHVKKHDPTFEIRMPEGLNPGQMADVLSHQLVVDTDARQRILETLSPQERVRLVIAELGKQSGAIARSQSKSRSWN